MTKQFFLLVKKMTTASPTNDQLIDSITSFSKQQTIEYKALCLAATISA